MRRPVLPILVGLVAGAVSHPFAPASARALEPKHACCADRKNTTRQRRPPLVAQTQTPRVATAAPDDAPSDADRVRAAIEMTLHPERRGEGIAALTALERSHGDSVPVRRELARALSWEGRFAESIQEYDWLLANVPPPERKTYLLERLHVLEWSGRLKDAERGYEELRARDSRDVDALIGLARARRAAGRPLAARAPAERAVRLEPDRREAREELAWIYAAVGRGRAATAIVGGETVPYELGDRLAQLRRPAISISNVAAANSFGILRIAPRATVGVSLPHDLTLTVGAGMTHLEQNATAPLTAPRQVDYASAAAALSVPWGPVRFAGSLGIYAGRDITSFDGHGKIAVRPVDGFSTSVAFRHHPFVELVDPVTTDEQMFHGAGVGGAQALDQALPLQVNALSLDFLVNPWSWGFLYGGGRLFQIDDGNQGYSVAAGVGINTLGFFSRTLPVALYARWDTYITGYQQSRTAYYSPTLLDVHSVGPELRLRAWKLELSAAGGATLALIESAPHGWFAGGGAKVATRHIALEARADYRADPYYQSWRAWLGAVVYP